MKSTKCLPCPLPFYATQVINPASLWMKLDEALGACKQLKFVCALHSDEGMIVLKNEIVKILL